MLYLAADEDFMQVELVSGEIDVAAVGWASRHVSAARPWRALMPMIDSCSPGPGELLRIHRSSEEAQVATLIE